MSKKSRRRNKKILAALALAGGAAMLGKGRNLGVSGADKAAFTSDAAYKLPSKAVVAADIAKDVVPHTSDFQTRYKRKVDGNWITPGTLLNERAALPGAGVEGPPSILNPYRPPRTHRMRGMNYKKGGRVTGIAKRGLGRAVMKGKN